jgi:hypothetical protein
MMDEGKRRRPDQGGPASGKRTLRFIRQGPYQRKSGLLLGLLGGLAAFLALARFLRLATFLGFAALLRLAGFLGFARLLGLAAFFGLTAFLALAGGLFLAGASVGAAWPASWACDLAAKAPA